MEVPKLNMQKLKRPKSAIVNSNSLLQITGK
jgi:hypothetical protein